MFKVDEQGDLRFTPTSIIIDDVEEIFTFIDEPVPEEHAAEPEPTVEVKTLRAMLYEQELSHIIALTGVTVSPGVRRLHEKRINRTLHVVADWLDTISQHASASKVRTEIVWPERDTHLKAMELAQDSE